MRSLAVSPARDGAETAARLRDLGRLYDLVVRGEDEGDSGTAKINSWFNDWLTEEK